jgi:hypothetical protein
MKYVTPFRIATYLLVLFCAAHTAGGMLAQESLGPSADAVFEQMKAVQFQFNGATCTWYGFWFGFGITVSVFLLLSAVIAWQLDKVPPNSWPAVSTIAWALVVSHAINAYLSWRYFFLGPVIFGVVITALMAYGAHRKGQRSPAT